MTDKPTWPKLADLKPGDRLVADGGFTCLADGEVVTVEADAKGELFVRCAGPDEGDNADAAYGKPSTPKRGCEHGLDGQENEAGEVVGLSRAL